MQGRADVPAVLQDTVTTVGVGGGDADGRFGLRRLLKDGRSVALQAVEPSPLRRSSGRRARGVPDFC